MAKHSKLNRVYTQSNKPKNKINGKNIIRVNEYVNPLYRYVSNKYINPKTAEDIHKIFNQNKQGE